MTAPESLFARGLRILGPVRLKEHLAGIRLVDFAPDVPEEFGHLSALDAVDHLWELIGRPEQQPPAGDWLVWAIVSGRGWGKSRTAAQFVVSTADETGRLVAGQLAREAAKILVVAPTSADLRDVCVEGDGGILRASPPWARPEYEPSKRRLTWATGVEAVLMSRTRSTASAACKVWPHGAMRLPFWPKAGRGLLESAFRHPSGATASDLPDDNPATPAGATGHPRDARDRHDAGPHVGQRIQPRARRCRRALWPVRRHAPRPPGARRRDAG